MAEKVGPLEAERQRRLERRRQRMLRPVTREETLRRNLVERIKEERPPYELGDDLLRLANTPYEEIPENDILRLEWLGLYHDKPKIGEFMLRIKIPGGGLTADQLRSVGQLAVDYGQDEAELTTRQDIQLHHLRLPAVPEVFARLAGAGLSSRGGCGDVLRNVTSCPVAGLDREELFDVTPYVRLLQERFSAGRRYENLPRKHKWTVAACPYHCNAPEIHDVALVGVVQGGRPGFAVWVGGGLSTVPRIAQSLGVFVTPEQASDVLAAILDVWSSDLRYRASRARARFKFMVEDHQPQGIRQLVQQRLGWSLEPLHEEPRPIGRTTHMGVHPQKQSGLYYIGFPVFPGKLSGRQLICVADIVAEVGGAVRLTRQQNLIVVNVPQRRVQEVVDRMERDAALPLDVHPMRAQSIGCTGDPLCNFAVAPTKRKLMEVVDRLESRFGAAVADLHIHLDGCPHACGQHWVGDIGIQGTTTHVEKGKIPAYDILLRGGLGSGAAVARAVVRRVPHDQLADYVERLVQAYLSGRRSGETIQEFFGRHGDEELAAVARGDAAVTSPQAASADSVPGPQ